MDTLSKKTFFIRSFIFLLFVSVAVKVMFNVKQNFSWAEMDWNQDGTVSVAEFFSSADVGKRPIKIGNEDCTEYFAFKDGLRIKTMCPLGNSTHQ